MRRTASCHPDKNNGGPIIISSASNDPAYFTTQLQVIEGSGLLTRVAKSIDLEHNAVFRNSGVGQHRWPGRT